MLSEKLYNDSKVASGIPPTGQQKKYNYPTPLSTHQTPTLTHKHAFCPTKSSLDSIKHKVLLSTDTQRPHLDDPAHVLDAMEAPERLHLRWGSSVPCLPLQESRRIQGMDAGRSFGSQGSLPRTWDVHQFHFLLVCRSLLGL